MIKEVKNVLKKEEAAQLKHDLTSNTFPWFIKKGIVNNTDTNYQFVHNFYDEFKFNSDRYHLIHPVSFAINPSSIIRIKSNLLPRAEKIIEHEMHTDIPFAKNHKTAIYYVNTNNGYTKFEDGTKISSEENKLVIFEGNMEHTGTTCTDEDYRIVINFNYFESV